MTTFSNLNRRTETSGQLPGPLAGRNALRRVRAERQLGPTRLPGGRRWRRRASALLLAALAGFALPSQAVVPSAEKLLPDDTLVTVTIPDFAKMRQIWQECPQARLWNDPAMKPFKDKFLAKWKEEFVQPLERDLGVRFDDFGNLPQGQVTFALTQNGWQGGDDPSPAMLLLLDSKDKQDQLKKTLADLRKKWVDAGKGIRTETIRGVEFSVVPLSRKALPQTLQKALSPAESEGESDAKSDAGPRKELAVGQFQSLLVVGDSIKAIEKVMVHLTGGGMPALGDLAAYEANRLALFRNAPFYGWVNLKALIDVLSRKSAGNDQSESADPFPVFNPAKIVTAVGLGSLKTLAFSFQNSEEGSSAQVFVGVPESGRQGILKLFPAAGKESSPPPFVPADVMKFQRCRVDGFKAWTTLQSVLNDINSQLSSALNSLIDKLDTAAKQKDPDFDVRRNLFGNLGDDMISYAKAPRANTSARLPEAPSLFLISSPQPDQLASALKSIGGMSNPQGGGPAEREFLGRKIFSIPLPALPVPTADPSLMKPRTLSCVASGGYVALSTDAAILEEYLRSADSQQKALRDTPAMTAAAAKVGGTSTGCFGYENQVETTRMFFEHLRKLSAASTNGAAAGGFNGSPGFPGPANMLREWMDFSLLPPFDKISKYFYFTVYSAGASTDGLNIKWFAPTPPGLKK